MRDSVRFILGGRVEEVRQCNPTETVLDFLRNEKGRVGTKEGCAEGDCGACTVVVVEVAGDALRYRAVNACILFLPTLDGKQLITVEDLQTADGALHGVQRAMVEQHGSQCGFCTPGFVMSLFAMFHTQNGRAPSRQEIDENLAGNLCRCTGYAPIVRAAQQSLTTDRSDQFNQHEKGVLEQLKAWRDEDLLAMEYGGRHYFAPTTREQLCTLLDTHPGATMVAGATDVGLWVTKQLQQIDTLVYTGMVAELNIVEFDEAGGVLAIGAAVTYTRALSHILDIYPDFEELLSRLGAVQVRNVGTIGGNIANGSPIADMPPALIALGTRLVLASSDGERTIDLEDFFVAYGKQDLQPGECISRILLPLPEQNQQFRTYKLCKRFEQDISAVCAAFCVDIRDGKVSSVRACYGGMAETPRRAMHCEEALMGQPWNEQSIDQAMRALQRDFEPISDMRASAQYRMSAAQNLLKRFFLETSDKPFPVRLEPRYSQSGATP